MATIRSLETYIDILIRTQIGIEDVIEVLRNAKTLQDTLHYSAVTREADIHGILGGLSTQLGTRIGTAISTLAENIEIWGVKMGNRFVLDSRDWDSTAVDVDDGASGSTLTINQDVVGDVFTAFDAADEVEITKAEDPNHNGFYTIATVTGQVLTFDDTMLGKDNANDETMIITLVER